MIKNVIILGLLAIVIYSAYADKSVRDIATDNGYTINFVSPVAVRKVD